MSCPLPFGKGLRDSAGLYLNRYITGHTEDTTLHVILSYLSFMMFLDNSDIHEYVSIRVLYSTCSLHFN